MAQNIQVYSPDIEATIALLEEFPTILSDAKRSALSSVGFLMIEATRSYIESGGRNAWKVHPFTLRYNVRRQFGFRSGFKPYGAGQSRFTQRGFFRGKVSAFKVFGRFARYLIFRDQVMLGFSTVDQPPNFNRDLEKVVARIQEGETTPVTPRMRRFFGATANKGKEKGVNFFPLKKSTTVLRTPARKIEGPVFQSIKGVMPLLFEKKLSESLGRKKISNLLEGEQ